MTEDAREDDARIEELLRLNAALDEQVRQLVRTEQKLFLSQRDLARQNARLDALNQFAIDVSALARAERILEQAADVLFALFPLDQYVAFLGSEDERLLARVVRAVPGREPDEERARAALESAVDAELDTEPVVGRADDLRALHGPRALLELAERVFAADDADTGETAGAWTMVLPLPRLRPRDAGDEGPVEGALLFRRRAGPFSFHEELPSESDLAFLRIFARQVAASLTNARLLSDLQLSYQRLADAQRERVQRERLAALGELAAVVAHEVRNPLGAIFNALSVLTRLVPAEGDAPGMLAIVREESGRLNQIVSDLLDFARPHAPTPKPEPIAPLVESAVESVRMRFPRARIEVFEDGGPVVAWADARMLRQALVNLVVNAVHASPEGEPIVVRVIGGASVRIEVEDQGPGVPAELAARVFEPFFTTRASGSGLGLSVVQRVAEAHGGRVELASPETGGAVFTLTFAAEREPLSVARGSRRSP